jgi:hypothetical protein
MEKTKMEIEAKVYVLNESSKAFVISTNNNPQLAKQIIEQWPEQSAETAMILIKEKIENDLITTTSQEIKRENTKTFIITNAFWCKMNSLYAVDVMVVFIKK